MKTPVIERGLHHANAVAELSRKMLRDAGVFTVSVLGGPGCGKTSLIDASIQALMPEVRVGVIACDVASHVDADRMTRHSDQVIQVNIGEGGALDASYIRDALEWLDLKSIDILFIENIGTLVGKPLDLGQDVTVAMFSVAAGDDKAEKHAEIVRGADVIVLNKIDLLAPVPFDIERFRGDVTRLNPAARLFELSALRGDGFDAWIKWAKKPPKPVTTRASNWFG